MDNDEGLQRDRWAQHCPVWLQFCQHSHILFIPSTLLQHHSKGGIYFTHSILASRMFLANTAQGMSEPQRRIVRCSRKIEARSHDLVGFGSSPSTWVNSWTVPGIGVMQREAQDSYSHRELLCPAGEHWTDTSWRVPGNTSSLSQLQMP